MQISGKIEAEKDFYFFDQTTKYFTGCTLTKLANRVSISMRFFLREMKTMDYEKLAAEMVKDLHQLQNLKPHKQLGECMQGEHFVIMYIAQQRGSVLPSKISKIMGISSARIAAALNSLERKGLVTRQIDPNDRRRILVDLTPAGQAKAAAKTQLLRERTTLMLTLLGEDDAKDLVRLIKRLVALTPEFNLDENKAEVPAATDAPGATDSR